MKYKLITVSCIYLLSIFLLILNGVNFVYRNFVNVEKTSLKPGTSLFVGDCGDIKCEKG